MSVHAFLNERKHSLQAGQRKRGARKHMHNGNLCAMGGERTWRRRMSGICRRALELKFFEFPDRGKIKECMRVKIKGTTNDQVSESCWWW